MRSGSTVWTVPSSRSCPWMRSVLVPIPSILAPIFAKHSATSPTSGSRAAFSITVSPSARAALIITVWVAPTETLGKTTLAPFRRFGHEVAAVNVNARTQRLEAEQMQIDRTRANGAATGHRHACATAARQQRTQHPKARPHAIDHFIGRRGVHNIPRGKVKRFAQVRRGIGALAVDGEIDAVIAQDARQQIDVGEVGHVFQGKPVTRQQTGDHQRQGRVLGPRNRDRPCEATATDDVDAIHGSVPFARAKANNAPFDKADKAPMPKSPAACCPLEAPRRRGCPIPARVSVLFALRDCCAVAERAVLVGARARSLFYRPAYSFTTWSASSRLAVSAAS